MHCLSFTDPELLSWLRSQLRTASSFTAFAADADEDGLALLTEPLSALLERDGRVRLVVPTPGAAQAAGRALPSEGGGLTVDVAPAAAGANVYVLEGRDGTRRAYLGATPLTAAGLTTSAAGVVLDQRRDDADARTLLADRTRAADAALTAPVPVVMLEDLMQPVMDELESWQGRSQAQRASRVASASGDLLPGLPTGSQDLDALTGGLQAGDLWVVTGRSGAGKSIFALGLARHVAIRSRARTALLSTRASLTDTTCILLSAEARVPLHYLRFGSLGDDDWARLARRMGEVAEAPLLLRSAGGPDATGVPVTAAQRIGEARGVAARHDLSLLIVDDLPATVTTVEFGALKGLAEQLGVCVVAVVGEDARRPLTLTERVAGGVADVVVRVDRDHELPLGTDSPRAGEVDLRVLRHRRGPTSVITLAFQGHYGRFVEMAADTTTSSEPGLSA